MSTTVRVIQLCILPPIILLGKRILTHNYSKLHLSEYLSESKGYFADLSAGVDKYVVLCWDLLKCSLGVIDLVCLVVKTTKFTTKTYRFDTIGLN